MPASRYLKLFLIVVEIHENVNVIYVLGNKRRNQFCEF